MKTININSNFFWPFNKYGLSIIIAYGLFFSHAFGQVTGMVTGEDGSPIPFSNILLLDMQDSSLIKGTVADQSGAYLLEDVNPGDYIIGITSVGYESYYTEPIKINKNSPSYNRGIITLKESLNVLDGVVISERKPLFEQKIDRLVVNVESSITYAGNSALEVLRKSPGVQVNLQNNSISLNGKGGVVVMINNKITRLPTDAVVQMMDGMSAANIEKIELITTPPSKYDAEGTAGIIHIVLKENEDLGTNGSFGLQWGYNGSNYSGANLNLFHRKNKIGYLIDYSINVDNSKQFVNNRRSNFHNGMNRTMANETDRDPSLIVQNLRSGFEYNFSNKTKVDALITGFRRDWEMDAISNTKSNIGTDSVVMTTLLIHETNLWQGFTTNVGLDQQLGENQFLSFDFDYIFYKNHNPSNYGKSESYVPSGEAVDSKIDVKKRTPLSVKVANVDYSNQLSRVKLDAGVKVALSSFNNDVQVVNFTKSTGESVDSLTNIAELNEKVVAAYVSSNWNVTENITFNAGLRYEFTDTQLETKTEKDAVDRRFHNFFPTVYLQKKLGEHSSFNLSYGRRITRPTFMDMAPFVYISDPYTFFSGNSALRPAITDNYKADLNWRSWLFSLQYSGTKDVISRFQPKFDPETNIQILSARNMDLLKTWNFTSSIPFSPFNWWDIQTNLIANYQILEPDSKTKDFRVYSYEINVTNVFILPSDFSIELSGAYQSNRIMGLWEFQAQGAVNVGIQKKLERNLGTLRLSANDLFNTDKWVISSLENKNDVMVWDWQSRSINLTYTKGFGNSKLKKVVIKRGSESEQRRVN